MLHYDYKLKNNKLHYYAHSEIKYSQKVSLNLKAESFTAIIFVSVLVNVSHTARLCFVLYTKYLHKMKGYIRD